jgi:hypothetical protein
MSVAESLSSIKQPNLQTSAMKFTIVTALFAFVTATSAATIPAADAALDSQLADEEKTGGLGWKNGEEKRGGPGWKMAEERRGGPGWKSGKEKRAGPGWKLRKSRREEARVGR